MGHDNKPLMKDQERRWICSIVSTALDLASNGKKNEAFDVLKDLPHIGTAFVGRCETCDGTGKCKRCSGRSYVLTSDDNTRECSCNGGKCSTCDGTGRQ